MEQLARRLSVEKYRRDILIMAAFEQNVEKFLLPPFGADPSSMISLRLGTSNR